MTTLRPKLTNGENRTVNYSDIAKKPTLVNIPAFKFALNQEDYVANYRLAPHTAFRLGEQFTAIGITEIAVPKCPNLLLASFESMLCRDNDRTAAFDPKQSFVMTRYTHDPFAAQQG